VRYEAFDIVLNIVSVNIWRNKSGDLLYFIDNKR